jgi:hypothetical protein
LYIEAGNWMQDSPEIARYDYGGVPFNDQRALRLSELVDPLRQAGFLGTVELQAHYGNFCLEKPRAEA